MRTLNNPNTSAANRPPAVRISRASPREPGPACSAIAERIQTANATAVASNNPLRKPRIGPLRSTAPIWCPGGVTARRDQ